MAKGLRPFHANVKGDVEVRQTFQRLHASLVDGPRGIPGPPGEDGEPGPPGEDGGGGGTFRWRTVWPPIPSTRVHEASASEMVLVAGGQVEINFPELTTANDGTMIAVVTGLNDIGGASDVVVTTVNGAADVIERNLPWETTRFDLTDAVPDPGNAKVYIFVGSFAARSWYVIAEWHRNPAALRGA